MIQISKRQALRVEGLHEVEPDRRPRKPSDAALWLAEVLASLAAEKEKEAAGKILVAALRRVLD